MGKQKGVLTFEDLTLNDFLEYLGKGYYYTNDDSQCPVGVKTGIPPISRAVLNAIKNDKLKDKVSKGLFIELLNMLTVALPDGIPQLSVLKQIYHLTYEEEYAISKRYESKIGYHKDYFKEWWSKRKITNAKKKEEAQKNG